MDRYMITHSLLSSWLYTMRDNPYETADSTDDPMADFLWTLRREPTPTTEAMQKGIDFENLITAILTKQPVAVSHDYDYRTKQTVENTVPVAEHKWYPAAVKTLQYVDGALLQVPVSKTVEIEGMSILFYGRLDALVAGRIYDIKFSGSYDRGKYYESTQHPMYLELVPEADSFVYVVSNGTEVWTEEYRRDEVMYQITDTAADFIRWIGSMGYMDLFKERWLAK